MGAGLSNLLKRECSTHTSCVLHPYCTPSYSDMVPRLSCLDSLLNLGLRLRLGLGIGFWLGVQFGLGLWLDSASGIRLELMVMVRIKVRNVICVSFELSLKSDFKLLVQ